MKGIKKLAAVFITVALTVIAMMMPMTAFAMDDITTTVTVYASAEDYGGVIFSTSGSEAITITSAEGFDADETLLGPLFCWESWVYNSGEGNTTHMVVSMTISNVVGEFTLYATGASLSGYTPLDSWTLGENPPPDPDKFSLTITSPYSFGVMECKGGDVVDIEAYPAPDGLEFDAWTGDVEYVADVTAASTTVTMPARNISLAATYRNIYIPPPPPATYTLAVTNGTGSGEYEADTVVAITANAAPTGKEFDAWTGDVTYVANANSASTTVTMPDGAVNITATYKDVVVIQTPPPPTPQTPAPSTPAPAATTTTVRQSPKTGDDMNVGGASALAGIALLGLGLARRFLFR